MIFKKKNKSDKNSDLLKYFLNSEYQKHNIARLQHLDSLGIDLSNKKVLEFGAGIGDHTLFYLYRNCKVTCTEGRIDLVEFIKNRLGIDAKLIDVEKDLSIIETFDKVDIVHCYGLLYHINNPAAFIETISKKGEMLFLETCVSGDQAPYGVNLVQEPSDNPTQAISGQGCRPSRQWIFDTLKQHYPYVYMPNTQPNHLEFPIDWGIDSENARLKRSVFIASYHALSNKNLSESVLKIQIKHQSE